MCILLVEDEWIVLFEVMTTLSDAGYEVLPAENGHIARDHVDKHPHRFTCLVTDHLMPGGMNGSDLVEYMRPRYPAIPIILATATPGAVGGAWAQQHAVHVLAKPFSSDTLLERLRRLL